MAFMFETRFPPARDEVRGRAGDAARRLSRMLEGTEEALQPEKAYPKMKLVARPCFYQMTRISGAPNGAEQARSTFLPLETRWQPIKGIPIIAFVDCNLDFKC